MAKIKNIFPKRKRIWGLWIIALLFIFALTSCGPTKLTLTHAHLKPHGYPASPILLKLGTTLAEWENDVKPQLKTKLQGNVYGFLPVASSTHIISHKILTDTAYDGRASIEEYTLTAKAVFNGKTNETKPFKMVVVIPNLISAPRPVILMESFCPNHNTVVNDAVSEPMNSEYSCEGNAVMNSLMLYVFGRYIATPPMEMILDHGYAFATIYPSDYVPDQKEAGQSALVHLSQGHHDDNTRWGAIAAWAWGYSRMIDVLETDTRFSKKGWISYGHSRYGKAALLAGAFDERINAVIAHQSVTGGASLNTRKKGESIKEITTTFPHWFSKSYANFAGREDEMGVDQHALLGLIAPTPIFLGNARRDVWSDPNGAFRAAQAASPVYKLYNKQGLVQSDLKSFLPAADISFYIPQVHTVSSKKIGPRF